MTVPLFRAVWPIDDLTEFSPRTLAVARTELPWLADRQQVSLLGEPRWLLVCLSPAVPRILKETR